MNSGTPPPPRLHSLRYYGSAMSKLIIITLREYITKSIEENAGGQKKVVLESFSCLCF